MPLHQLALYQFAPDHDWKRVLLDGHLSLPNFGIEMQITSRRICNLPQAASLRPCCSATDGSFPTRPMTGFDNQGWRICLLFRAFHMGLLCFGVIGFARLIGALLPTTASRLPMHKICAVIGLFAGAAYVFASGMPISAIRAFLMASLVIAALLLDRLALTVRNVALACMVILLFNPLAVFTASFQLSFAATLGLVLWYESTACMSRDHKSQLAVWPWPFRYITALMITSLIAGFATWPFAAQHFGGVTIWGVAANILGIPLTGLWIMPAGLLSMFCHCRR